MAASFRTSSVLTLALSVVLRIAAAEDSKHLHGHLSLPTKKWGVALDLPGFTLKNVQTMPDGRRYMIAQNESTNLVVSLALEQIHSNRSASCSDSLQERAKHPPFKVRDVRFWHQGEFDFMEYIVPTVKGKTVNQKSIYACELYDNSYIDLHLSKISYSPSDDSLFAGVLNTAHIENVQRASMELLQEASRLYFQHSYKAAIEPYSQALELEKVNPKLDKRFWYVLVDNLGMSYGITGDLQKAKETLEYGVSKDLTYPLFYYNLACTYAEMNDVTNASSYLKKAFAYKANTLPGESMPDPRTDDSFKKLMKSKEFRELVRSLTGSP
jgi:tetratricopeptide (TPR) repeat protein